MENQVPTPNQIPKVKTNKPRKKPNKRKKRPFVKKASVFMCTNNRGEAFKIYADDDADARKIFKGIHKEDAVKVTEQKKVYKRKEHLTNRPFEGLDKIVKEND